jgi:predicted ATP-dependent serine protease
MKDRTPTITSRSLSLTHIYNQKFKTIAFDGVWANAFGEPEQTGVWIIWGAEKNGKTWFALKLAGYLSTIEPVLYISAEEKTRKTFQESCRRAGLGTEHKRFHAMGYISIPELDERLSKRKSARIVFIDNCTIYKNEFKKSEFQDFIARHSDKLFVMIAHEERNEPYTAIAQLAKKLADIIVHVKGLTCMVSGRCPGGILTIDEQMSRLYWGNDITEK